MKQDVLAAQNAVLAKKGNGVNSVCKVHLLASSSTGTTASSLLPDRPLVLSLPAVPFSSESAAEVQEESGSDLKKRKRMLNRRNEVPFDADGVVGNDVIGSNVSHGGDDDMYVTAGPIDDEQVVMAGPDDQACLGK